MSNDVGTSLYCSTPLLRKSGLRLEQSSQPVWGQGSKVLDLSHGSNEFGLRDVHLTSLLTTAAYCSISED